MADYAASLRARIVVIGLNPDYPGDQWHHGLSQLVMTYEHTDLEPLMVHLEILMILMHILLQPKEVPHQLKVWAIHPSQIELANKVFSPPDAEVIKQKNFGRT